MFQSCEPLTFHLVNMYGPDHCEIYYPVNQLRRDVIFKDRFMCNTGVITVHSSLTNYNTVIY